MQPCILDGGILPNNFHRLTNKKPKEKEALTTQQTMFLSSRFSPLEAVLSELCGKVSAKSEFSALILPRKFIGDLIVKNG